MGKAKNFEELSEKIFVYPDSHPESIIAHDDTLGTWQNKFSKLGWSASQIELLETNPLAFKESNQLNRNGRSTDDPEIWAISFAPELSFEEINRLMDGLISF